MEQIKNDNKITEVESIKSSIISATNEKVETSLKEVDDGNDKTQYERSAKRTELIRSTEKGSTSSKNPVYIEWHGLNYSILHENKKPFWKRKFGCSGEDLNEEVQPNVQTIIENIHGCANPGEILAIMGPSGCGKTTLLNLLVDRISNGSVKGTVTMNGHKPTKNSKRYIAYCTQDDIFFPHLTVKETLGYTARLRLPRTMSGHDKLQQVENTMQLLNLMKCADTKMGDAMVRGVSGGEKKRVNIASELLTDPSVILLDEPTTGLDSSLALELTTILKEFAVKQGKTIIMVIHQPSSQVFESFDKLILMGDGQMVYFGERAKMVDYLANQGFKCNPNFNPADYILELLNEDVSKQKLIEAYANQIREDPTGRQIIEKYSGRVQNNNNNVVTNVPVKSEHRWEATFLQQVSILTERAFKQSIKVIISKVDFAQTLALSLTCCLIWFRMPYEEVNINDRLGVIFFTCGFWSFYPLLGPLSSFPLDIVILSKERQSRSYRLLSFFLSKQLAELPLILFNPVIYNIIVYWASGLLPDVGRFFAYLIVNLLSILTTQGFGYLFGSAILDVRKSMTVSVVFMSATILLGGYFVRKLPFGLTWLKYLSFVTYSYNLLMQIQFDSPKAQFKCSSQETLGIGQTSICNSMVNATESNSFPGTTVLENEGLNELPWYINLIILLGFCIAARCMAYFSLHRNTRSD